MKVAVIGSSDNNEYPEATALYRALYHQGIYNAPDSSERPDAVATLAEKLGRLLAEAGHIVIAGGYGGDISAVAKGAREAGGEVISSIIRDIRENTETASNREEVRRNVLDRLAMAIAEADVCIVLPGISNITLSIDVAVHTPLEKLSPKQANCSMICLYDNCDDDALVKCVEEL